MAFKCYILDEDISIHALREEGDSLLLVIRYSAPFISIHALREEGDLPIYHSGHPPKHFYPRPPRGGRRGKNRIQHTQMQFLSTPSARRATVRTARWKANESISIHALREEGDEWNTATSRDLQPFLSTPSARRATTANQRKKRNRGISIHALREEGDRLEALACPEEKISIHALREEGDPS